MSISFPFILYFFLNIFFKFLFWFLVRARRDRPETRPTAAPSRPLEKNRGPPSARHPGSFRPFSPDGLDRRPVRTPNRRRPVAGSRGTVQTRRPRKSPSRRAADQNTARTPRRRSRRRRLRPTCSSGESESALPETIRAAFPDPHPRALHV